MESVVGNWDQEKDVEDGEKILKSAKSAIMLDAKISKFSDI